MRYLPIQFDPVVMSLYVSLFAMCFPTTRKFNASYLDWLYACNPEGCAIGFDAWDGEQLVAHYACIPTLARINGTVVRAALSLNTATHPDYRGKGLFTRLAEMTYQAASEQEFKAIYGVANANSTHGFVHKLSFQLVRPLEARVGLGHLCFHSGQAPSEASFERIWTEDSIGWRFANPNNPISWRLRNSCLQFQATAMDHIVSAYGELFVDGLAPRSTEGKVFISPLRLFIGLTPDRTSSYRNYVSIPNRWRPSPLNLIFRALSPGLSQIDASSIQFTFLDFDAY